MTLPSGLVAQASPQGWFATQPQLTFAAHAPGAFWHAKLSGMPATSETSRTQNWDLDAQNLLPQLKLP